MIHCCLGYSDTVFLCKYNDLNTIGVIFIIYHSIFEYSSLWYHTLFSYHKHQWCLTVSMFIDYRFPRFLYMMTSLNDRCEIPFHVLHDQTKHLNGGGILQRFLAFPIILWPLWLDIVNKYLDRRNLHTGTHFIAMNE